MKIRPQKTNIFRLVSGVCIRVCAWMIGVINQCVCGGWMEGGMDGWMERWGHVQKIHLDCYTKCDRDRATVKSKHTPTHSFCSSARR